MDFFAPFVGNDRYGDEGGLPTVITLEHDVTDFALLSSPNPGAGQTLAEQCRHAAFVSYSSSDAKFCPALALSARALWHSQLAWQFRSDGGGKKNRIYAVFRDREELSVSDLAERIEASLCASAALIVVCSTNAAASPWVQKEIEYFIGLGRADRIFAIISEGTPLFDEAGYDATEVNWRQSVVAANLSTPPRNLRLQPK